MRWRRPASPAAGPSRAAAQLEGSKTFTKEICDAAGIPTAQWERFDDADAAREFIRRRGAPIVVKADGLAAGKGVVVAATEDEALAAIDAMMEARAFGEAGAAVVIEECLTGDEVSLFALCDGEDALPLGSAQDHKRVGDGDTGPNTGGMGSYSPTPMFPPALEQAAMDRIIRPTLAEMARRGTPFRGILYAGLMLTADGPKLIEFNVRFGDPGVPGAAAAAEVRSAARVAGRVRRRTGELRPALARRRRDRVVMAARGYPEAPERGSEIRGLDRAAAMPGVQIFHAGTEADAAGAHPRRRRTRADRVRHRRRRCARGARRRLCRGATRSTGRRASAATTSAGGRWAGGRRTGDTTCMREPGKAYCRSMARFSR